MNLMKNMFDQFNPAYLGPLSLTTLGAYLAVSWTAYLTTTHWAPNRKGFLSNTVSATMKMMLPQSMKTTWTQILIPMFLLCLSYNLLSLIPYTFSPTSHLSMTFSLSMPLWMGVKMMGIWHKWRGKMSHLVPQGTPSALMPLMMMIELMSLCIQPLTLGFRLGANLLAGHLLMFLCSCMVWETVAMGPLGYISMLLLLTLFVLEMAVACMQATVFMILMKNYFEENFS